MKKMLAALLAITVLFSLTPIDAEAKRGGFKSSRGSFQQSPSTPNKTQDNVVKSDSSSTSSANRAATGTTAGNRGFFSGGSLMKGLMIGGIAGLLFGSFLGPLGGFGEFLGLLLNVLAIYLLFVLGRTLYRNYKSRQAAERRRY